jgi:hypothetical protein
MVVRNIKRKPSPSCSMFVALNNGMGVRLTRIHQGYNDLIADTFQICVSSSNPLKGRETG